MPITHIFVYSQVMQEQCVLTFRNVHDFEPPSFGGLSLSVVIFLGLAPGWVWFAESFLWAVGSILLKRVVGEESFFVVAFCPVDGF